MACSRGSAWPRAAPGRSWSGLGHQSRWHRRESEPSRGRNRKDDPKRGVLPHFAFHGDSPPVLLDDPGRDRQSEAGALGLGRRRAGRFGRGFLRGCRGRIRNGHLDNSPIAEEVLAEAGADGELPSVRHGLPCIDQNVQEGLVEEARIQTQRREARLKAPDDLDPRPRCHGQEPEGLFHHFTHVQREVLRRGRPRVPEQVGERLVHPRHLGLDLREQGLPGIRLGELVGQNVQSPGNAGQGIP